MNRSTWSEVIRVRPSTKDLLPVLLVLVLIAVFSWRSTQDKSNTGDEMVHLLAGYSAWTNNDFRINPENGNIPSRISALPFLFIGEGLILDTDSLEWEKSSQWHLGYQMLYASPVPHRKILRLSHASMLIFNMIGMALVFLWSGFLWGRGGAYLSLLLAGFSPNFLGHMPLATSDFAGAWTLVLAVFAITWLTERITPARIVTAGLCAGLALTCKHSAILLGPVGLILILVRALDSRSLVVGFAKKTQELSKKSHKLLILVTASLFLLGPCLIFIWAVYGFRYSAANPDVGAFESFLAPWNTLSPTILDFWINLLRKGILLPESFLYGLNFILSNGSRGAFLNGVFSEEGFITYHLWSFLYKTPLPALFLHVLGLGVLAQYLWQDRSIHQRTLIRGILVLSAVYWALLLSSDISIGHRHAFVLLYLACTVTGICLDWAFRKSSLTGIVVVMCALSMVPLSWINIDRAISYINPLGGGSEGGYRRLIDSSLDWGQDLPSVAREVCEYQNKYPGNEVYLSYFGTADPSAYGMMNFHYLYAWGIWDILERADYVPELSPGLYVVSASEMESTPEDWSLELEIRYRQLQLASKPYYNALHDENALAYRQAKAILTEEEIRILNDYELFRTQRLKMNLGLLRPDKILHGSILLYELNQMELDAMEYGESADL